MIFSGWILPDFYEIKCVSCSGSKEHIQIVEKYLANLKVKDYYTFNKVMYSLYKNCTLSLDDFAVQALNWIKIIDKPNRYIYYQDNEDNCLMLQKYERLGFLLTPVKQIRTTFDIKIKSYELI